MFIELPPPSLARVGFAPCESGEADDGRTLTLPPRVRGQRTPGEGSRLLPAARREGRKGLRVGVEAAAAVALTFTPCLQPLASPIGESAPDSLLP